MNVNEFKTLIYQKQIVKRCEKQSNLEDFCLHNSKGLMLFELMEFLHKEILFVQNSNLEIPQVQIRLNIKMA